MAAPSQRGDTVVLALRQSPDWPALAADHARGLKIAPQRYMPAHDVPFFPGWLPDCIACWNTQFSVDFFACRAELRRIARATLDNVAGARVVDRADVLKHLPEGDFRLFFLDDDDWFAPDSARRLACTGDEDVAVFPLLRLDSPVVTFVRDAALSDTVIGVAQTFTFRYQTNNYGLHRRLTTPAMLDMLADHADASATAARIGLMDAYYDTLLSVTNKTPVSASVLMRIVDDANAFRRHVEAFVHALSALDLPPRERWMATPMRQTADLFNRALAAS
jgi:hypothetical protein